VQLHPANTPDELLVVAMQQTARGEFQRLQYGLGFLATVGSTSPFIGLFGTVWGIMNTFRDLGNAKSASLAVVAPGISSALIATAAGLAVAIPAVMAYNWFLAQLDGMQERTDSFIDRVTALVRASGYFQHGGPGATPPGPALATPPLGASLRPAVASAEESPR
jgi:biopolymer transport protein TolQ